MWMNVLSEGSPAEVIGWSAVLIVVILAGLGTVLRVKRWLQSDDTEAAPTPAMGFTLSDLRQMHRAGQLTDAEFEKAKDKVVVAAQKASARIQAAAADPAQRDSPDAIRARRLARETAESAEAARVDLPPDTQPGSTDDR